MSEDPAPTPSLVEQMAEEQARKLPRLVTRMALHLNAQAALEESTVADALELASADVVQSGRIFDELTDHERGEIFDRYYTYCRQRNIRYLELCEQRN